MSNIEQIIISFRWVKMKLNNFEDYDRPMRNVPQTAHMEHSILRDGAYIRKQCSLFAEYVNEDVEFIVASDMLRQQIDALAAVSREFILLNQLITICRVTNNLNHVHGKIQKQFDELVEVTQDLLAHGIENGMNLRQMMKKALAKKEEVD